MRCASVRCISGSGKVRVSDYTGGGPYALLRARDKTCYFCKLEHEYVTICCHISRWCVRSFLLPFVRASLSYSDCANKSGEPIVEDSVRKTSVE